jgi:NAD(P)-dependent dehydrogenase (short-subunit alcohol dehydrogenase family)
VRVRVAPVRDGLLSRGGTVPEGIVDLTERYGDSLKVCVYRADVTDEAATRAAFALAAEELGPISAVFHLSGVRFTRADHHAITYSHLNK